MDQKYFFLLLPFINGCSTVSETLFESDSPSYQRSVDSSGHTVYRSQRIFHESERDTPSVVSLMDLADTISTAFSQPSESYMTLAQSNPSAKDFSSALTMGMFVQEETFNSDISYEFVGDVFSWDLGLGMVNSDKLYLGFSTMARMHAPWKLAPYLGVGLYGGDSKTCTTQPIGSGYYEEVCEKYFLTSLVGEFGLRYIFNDRMQTRLAIRHFNYTRQGDPLAQTLYGLNIGVLF
ncbi:hypothetical protein K2X05_11330 [bacterium]|nr:hypothetical protein [bacterium]